MKQIMLLIIGIFAINLVFGAPIVDLNKEFVLTCSGNGMFYNFETNDPYARYDSSFVTNEEELIIFTKRAFPTGTDILVDGVKVNPQYVKSYRVGRSYRISTQPGDIIEIKNAQPRDLLAFLEQDPNFPMLDVNTGHGEIHNRVSDAIFMIPTIGMDFILFDKISSWPGGTLDTRKVTAEIRGSALTSAGPFPNLIFDKTYDQPFPVGTQGVVLDEYDITESGWYEFTVDTEDSIYWLLFECSEDRFSSCTSVAEPGCGVLETKNDVVSFDSNDGLLQYDLKNLVEAYFTYNSDGDLAFNIPSSQCFDFTNPNNNDLTDISPINPSSDCTEILTVQVFDSVYPELGAHNAFLEIIYNDISTEACSNVLDPGCGTLEVKNDLISFDDTLPQVIYDLKNLVKTYFVYSHDGQLNFAIPLSACFDISSPDNDDNIVIDPVDISSACVETLDISVSDLLYSQLGNHNAQLTIAYGELPQGLEILDSSIVFNYSSFPAHKYFLTEMLSNNFALPCNTDEINFQLFVSSNFDIIGPFLPDQDIDIVPVDWSTAANEQIQVDAVCSSYSDSAILDITYTANGAPQIGLDIEDRTVEFNYTSFPNHIYELTDMLSPNFLIPCSLDELNFQIETPSNFIINGPDLNNNLEIAPIANDWVFPRQEALQVDVSCNSESDSAILNIIYTADGAPDGQLSCVDTELKYILSSLESIVIDLDDIFNDINDPGEITFLEANSNDLIIKPNLPNDVEIIENGLSSEIVNFRARTNKGIWSPDCKVAFLNPNYNCERPICDQCFSFSGNNQITCLQNNNCIDGGITIFDPFVSKRSTDLAGIPVAHSVNLFSTILNNFQIMPSSGNSNQVFRINGQGADHGAADVSVLELNLEDYENNPVRICHDLTKVNFDIGEEIIDTPSNLIIGSSRAVSGTYEVNGQVFSKGPYIFTAKVWLR